MCEVIRKTLYAGGARAAVLVLTFVLITLSTRLMLGHASERAFGLVMTVATLPQLFPFADLGLGAAVMTEIGKSGGCKDARIQDLVSRVGLILGIVSAVIICVATLMHVCGLWYAILGLTPAESRFSIVSSLMLGGFAISVRLGVAFRILVGLNQTHLAIACQAVSPLVTLTTTYLLIANGASVEYLALASPLGILAANALMFTVASRVSGLALWRLPRRTQNHSPNRIRIRAYSIPMFTVNIATPLLFQVDRLIVAGVGGGYGLAAYALVYQIYGPLYNLFTATATPLWPHFARERERSGIGIKKFAKVTWIAVGVALCGGVAMIIFPGYYQTLVGGHDVGDVGPLARAFALVLVLQVTMLPSAMALNDARGLRFQAATATLAAAFKVGLAVVLVGSYGAVGAVVATSLSVGLFQLIPILVYMRRYLWGGPRGGGIHD